MSLFASIETARERWNVLEHPFYQRWSAGELGSEELAFYAGEYRHAVAALAEAFGRAEAKAADSGFGEDEREALAEHAREERDHVPLWAEFERALGGETDRRPRPETESCARAWTGGADTLEHLVATWVVESGQPEIAATKLAGLREHYEVAEGPATEYFRLHAELDHEHAAETRALIEEHLADEDLDRLLAVAERVLKGNWELLDGVDRAMGVGAEG